MVFENCENELHEGYIMFHVVTSWLQEFSQVSIIGGSQTIYLKIPLSEYEVLNWR